MTRHPYGCVEREYTWEGKMNTFSFYFRKSEENNNIQNIRYLRNGKSEQQSERILWSSVHEVPMYVDFLDQFDNRDLNSIRETFTITGLSLYNICIKYGIPGTISSYFRLPFFRHSSERMSPEKHSIGCIGIVQYFNS